jgi:hypothetical protein
LFLTVIAAGQIVSGTGRMVDSGISDWYSVNIDSTLLNRYEAEHINSSAPRVFAVPVNVSLTPENSGEIIETNVSTVWRIAVSSKNAKSLNLILSPFHLPGNAVFFLSDGDRKNIYGPFGSENNNPYNVLATTPVPGDRIILECHFPKGEDPAGKIGIRNVNHDFLGITGEIVKDGRYNRSQSCNVDINCSDGDDWQVLKNSVCRILVNGYELCSGVLLNNTNNENRAFLLTAEHCIGNADAAAASLFVFGYESPWCGGPDGRVLHSLSGSAVRAVNSQIDFAVVELSVFPPITYKPYLAGWDVSGIAPLNTVSIHHPEGDVKKISVDNNSPVTSTYPGLLTDGYWKVLQWEKGTTEGGSSGAPLFDQNRRMVGILTGGEAVCGRSVNDYFAKAYSMYDRSSLLWEQLKGWIDPARSGVKKYDGRDPYLKNFLSRDTLCNILPGETPFSQIADLPSTGYLTGFNSDSSVMYAEHFQNTGTRYITEVMINTSKENHVSLTDSARLFIMSGGTAPAAVIASQRIFLSETKDNFVLSCDFGIAREITGDFYIAWKLYYKQAAKDETRQFAVFHSPFHPFPSENTAWFLEGPVWRKFSDHPRKPVNISLDVKVVTVANSVVDNIENIHARNSYIRLYPNPASETVNAIVSADYRFENLKIISINGQVLISQKILLKPGAAMSFPVSNLEPGYYFVRFSGNNISETVPLIIVK